MGEQQSSKKQSNRTSIILVITVGIIIGVALIFSTHKSSNSSSDNTDTSSVAGSSTSTDTATSDQSQSAKPANPSRQVKGTAVTLGAGTFVGGEDVADGLYDVTTGAEQSGNFIVSGSDSYNEILGGDSEGDVPKVRVQISDGDKIELSGLSSVTFTPVTAKFITSHTTVSLYAGTFIVGEDVGAGQYVVTPGSGQSGNFIVSGDDSYNEILGGDSSMGDVPSLTVSLSDGDIVSISSLSQVVFTPSN